MTETLTKAAEDYLKVIFDLTAQDQRASTNEIAERAGVRPASVTWMIKKLAATDPPLIDYRKYRGVVLTKEGRKAALQVIRSHRLLESYLHQRLGYFWDEVHEVADNLEHVMTAELSDRIASELGEPDFDPHGEPIPNRELQIPEQQTTPLSEMRPEQRGMVQWVAADDPDFLRYLEKIGLVPRTWIEICGYSPFDGNLDLRLAGETEKITLGPRVTEKVYIKLLEANRSG